MAKENSNTLLRKLASYERKILGFPNWVLVILVVVFVLRIPSLFEPNWYGDEAIYLTLGEGVRQGRVLYSQIHDNKPPLLYLTAALAGNVFWFRAILAFWHMATIVLFWHLTKTLFPTSKKIQMVSLIVFSFLTTIPLFEGNIANSEIFMIGFTIAAFWLLLSRKLTPLLLFWAGVLFSVSSLFKMPAAFEVPTIVVLWFYAGLSKEVGWKNLIKNTLALSVGFISPILLSFVWYFVSGALGEYVVAAYLQNVGYLSAWSGASAEQSFLVKNLSLIIRAGIVGLGVILVGVWRGKLSKPFVFATVWLLFALFGVTLSERPYPHYIIQAVPPVALLVGILFYEIKKEQVYTIIPLTLFAFTLFYFKFWYYPTLSYYKNYVEFATGVKDRESYFNYFGGNVNRTYRVAEFLVENSAPGEKVFVWGDDPAIYALSRRLPPGRYVAAYHIQGFDRGFVETTAKLEVEMPKFVVLTAGVPAYAGLEQILMESYVLVANIDDTEIWKRAVNGELPRLLR